MYDRQAYQLSFYSFTISPEAKGLYIPSVKVFYDLTIENKIFDFPLDITNAKTKVFAFLKKNNITDELYLSYDRQDYSIAIKKNSFDSDKFIVFLENQLNIDVSQHAKTIKIGSKTFYYFTNNDFFVFSTLEIQDKSITQFDKPKGNYHYLIQKNSESTQHFFKHYKNEVYSFYTNQIDTIKGGSISPSIYYNAIPSNFDTLWFYGSSRFQNDVKSLTQMSTQSDFFSWIENSVIHLKKDSLEILIGLQNEFQNLSNMLDEQTIALSKDSLLPPSIFKNNYEIHSFQSNYDWESIIPFTTSEFNYYSEFNNFNVLGNSESAMNWFITELQLGNVFSTNAQNFHHPKKVNQLTINQTEGSHQLVSKNWINRTECFVSEVSNISNIQKESSNLPLLSTFFTTLKNLKIKTFIIEDTLEILLFNDIKIMSYTTLGEVNWTKDIESPLISFPTAVKVDSIEYIVLFMKNSIDVVDKNNLSLKGFPFQLNSMATKSCVIQNTSNFNLLVETGATIISINNKGQGVSNWTEQVLAKKLKSNIETTSFNGKSIISYVDENDSLFIKNELGESIFNSNSKVSLDNISNFMTGKQAGENLRMYGFSNPYIINQLVNTGQKDSLKINQKLTPTSVNWVKHENSSYLVIEEYNRVVLFNEFGLLEKEIQKPKPNLKLITNAFFDDDIVIFFDFKNKKLYLLDSYGRSTSENPVLGESNFDINYKNIVVYFNSNIYIYNLKTY